MSCAMCPCAIDCGDSVVAPKIRDLLRWTIRIGRRRGELRDTTLAQYHAKAERRLDALLGTPAAHPEGRALQAQIKAWRGKFFVFLTDRRVPATNNISEREIRPSVVFRKVTNGFRSEWGRRRSCRLPLAHEHGQASRSHRHRRCPRPRLTPASPRLGSHPASHLSSYNGAGGLGFG